MNGRISCCAIVRLLFPFLLSCFALNFCSLSYLFICTSTLFSRCCLLKASGSDGLTKRRKVEGAWCICTLPSSGIGVD